MLEQRRLLAVVDSLQLVDDSGADNDDLLTNDARIEAEVSWSDDDIDFVVLEFDHHGDGSVDGAVTLAEEGEINYDPAAVDQALNDFDDDFTLSYRLASHQGSETTFGEWSDFTFHLDRIAPHVAAASPSAGSLINQIEDVVLSFSEPLDLGTLTATNVFVRDSAQHVVGQTLSLLSSSKVSIDFTQAMDPQVYTSHAANYADLAGNPGHVADSDWQLESSPELTQPLPSSTISPNSSQVAIDLNEYFTDPDGNDANLTYEIMSVSGPLNSSNTQIDTGEKLVAEYLLGMYGIGQVVLKATDETGSSRTETAYITANRAPTLTQQTKTELEGGGWLFTLSLNDESPSSVELTSSANVTIDQEEGTVTVTVDDPTVAGDFTVFATDEFGATVELTLSV